ncbi:MAG: DUF2142 domain-containing protein [Chloroflexi bacterium]|nr:DUF2142 domain-containing protein [Chloroflexota bacterium]MBP8057436.1 DUF2142 domain-containing protein [Chloroflexota bacterium]
MNRLHPHCWFWLILALYLILAVAMSVVVPLGEAPDEVDHFLYVRHLVREKAFPVMDPVFANNETLEANQPPLYYLLGALLTGWIEMDEAADLPLNACFSSNPDDPGRQNFYWHSAAEQFPWRGTVLAFHLVRLLSVGLGAGTVGLAYGIGRQVKRDNVWVGVAAAAILAFNPQFIFITASANNDNLTAFLGAAIVLACIQLAYSPLALSPRRLIPLSLLIGLGLLTKFSLFGLWPLAFLAFGLKIAADTRNTDRKEHGWRALFKMVTVWPSLLVLVIVPLVVAGWWYGRGYQLYGDPLAWEVHLAAKGAYVLRTEPLRLADLGDFILTHFQSYWGWFGWLNIKWPVWVYGLLAVMVAAAIIGLFKGRNPEGQEKEKDGTRINTVGTPRSDEHGLNSPRRLWDFALANTAILFPTLATLIVYVALLRYIQTINWSGYQGRLAYTAAAPLAVLLAVGLLKLAGPRLAQAVGVALFALSLFSLAGVIAPAYPRPQIYQPSPQAVTFAPVCARFDAGLEIEAYQLDAPAYPGGSLPVTVYGYGLTDSPSPQTLAVQIRGREGQIAGQAQAKLAWMAGQVISLTLNVPVDAAALPTRAVLQIGLLTPAGEWQAATSPGGRQLDLPFGLTTVKIAPAEPVMARPQQAIGAEFGEQLVLLGYDRVDDGAEVRLGLYWRAAAALPTDYTFFVHLLDENGQLITQHDGQPQAGWYPTTLWAEGETVADWVTLTLPTDAPPGPYHLAIGVYQLETLTRLPVVWNGIVQPDGQLILNN